MSYFNGEQLFQELLYVLKNEDPALRDMVARSTLDDAIADIRDEIESDLQRRGTLLGDLAQLKEELKCLECEILQRKPLQAVLEAAARGNGSDAELVQAIATLAELGDDKIEDEDDEKEERWNSPLSRRARTRVEKAWTSRALPGRPRKGVKNEGTDALTIKLPKAILAEMGSTSSARRKLAVEALVAGLLGNGTPFSIKKSRKSR